jgi:hypothetical protein
MNEYLDKSNIYNKIKPQVKSEFLKTKVLVQNLYRDGVKPFFSKEDRERMAKETAACKSPDRIARLPLTGDSSTYFTTASVHTQIQSLLIYDYIHADMLYRIYKVIQMLIHKYKDQDNAFIMNICMYLIYMYISYVCI